MKSWIPAIMLGAVASLAAEEFPGKGTPTAFETRDVGDKENGGVSIRETRPRPKTRTITYIAVCAVREWRNTDGQVIRAGMLAFDRKPDAADDAPLELVRDGKVRLLLEDRKVVSEYPLSKLSEKDRAFVQGLIRARQAAAEKRRADDGEDPR